MKAINFLEWYKKQTTLLDTNLDYKSVLKWNNVAIFLSQPFRPEMIVELFEGWVWFSPTKEWVNDCSKSEQSIHLQQPQGVLHLRNRLGGRDNISNYPITLNDFISDCQRAGIELTFKKEIADKYFKP